MTYKPEIKKIFTLGNAKEHVSSYSNVIDAWWGMEGEAILVLAEETKDDYLLLSYHIDALDPNWDNLNISCVEETYIPKKVWEKMHQKTKKFRGAK